jgi:hypothetical protein
MGACIVFHGKAVFYALLKGGCEGRHRRADESRRPRPQWRSAGARGDPASARAAIRHDGHSEWKQFLGGRHHRNAAVAEDAREGRSWRSVAARSPLADVSDRISRFAKRPSKSSREGRSCRGSIARASSAAVSKRSFAKLPPGCERGKARAIREKTAEAVSRFSEVELPGGSASGCPGSFCRRRRRLIGAELRRPEQSI